MKQLTNILFIVFCLLTATLTQAQKKSNLLINDFMKVEGNWTGQLTYLDYSSGKPYTMSADLEIKEFPTPMNFFSSTLTQKKKCE
jgi:hypothetical protein